MKILHDDGLYRHIEMRQAGTRTNWYDITTWPGTLCINGDMGTYVFSRIPDMFEFFELKDGGINQGYWSDKCSASDSSSSIMVYSATVARKVLLDWIEGEKERYPYLHDHVMSELLPRADDGEHAFREAVDQFEHEDFEFVDFWEVSLREYSHYYLWCCHAIVKAIAAYRAEKSRTDKQWISSR